MKLYDSIGPNPRVVRMFLAEKGVEVRTVQVDIGKAENRQPDFVAKNPMGTLPVLELAVDAGAGPDAAATEGESGEPDPAVVRLHLCDGQV
jgi:hypothetical protein